MTDLLGREIGYQKQIDGRHFWRSSFSVGEQLAAISLSRASKLPAGWLSSSIDISVLSESPPGGKWVVCGILRAMSEENMEVAGQVMDAIAQRDLSRLIAFTDPEVEWHSFFAELGEGGAYRGHDALRRYVNDLHAWEIVRADVDDGVGVGDVAVLFGRIHYRGKASGIETEAPAGWMLKFRQGKVVCFRAFREPEQALEVVGLSE